MNGHQRRIAILTWGLQGGSLTNYTAALTQGFLDIGVKDLSIIYVTEGIGSHVTIPENVQLIPLGAQRSRWMPFYLAKYIREVQPDYLISVSTFINIPAILGWLLAGRGSTKLIVSEHSTLSYKAYVELKDDFRVKIQPFLVRWLYPLATGLHANSPVVLDDLLHTIRVRVPLERAIATPNPVNIDAIIQYSQAQPAHPWLKGRTSMATDNQPLIISVGRLAHQKNFPLLLKAFAKVRETLNAKLIILGEGPERTNLESLIKELGIDEFVSLPGFLPNPWACMARSDLFVLSSEEEPFGLVLVEAMACGVPVIATDSLGNGPRSVLGEGQHGILVRNKEENALAEAMLKLLTTPSLWNQFVKAGKDRCDEFRPNVVTQELLSFLQRL